jgi:UDP-GlcNAc:undecaprenyl-phosphate GlcNAc-1-phosphate transferase
MRDALFAIAGAFTASIVLTLIVRALARRFGIVARPKADRWHARPTAMLGGVAIFIALNGTLLATGRFAGAWVVLLASAILFGVGLVDDFVHLRPYQKLVCQVVAAAIVIQFGLVLPWTDIAALNIALTVFWLVGITNAVNMLDNMDGLAAGISAIAALSLGIAFLRNGELDLAILLAIFAAVLLGFLVFNFSPASIFMGDCGALFIGFFLASSALMSSLGGRSRSLLPVLAVPVLVLFIPIFDTTFVTILRKLAGRPASQGGRDHTSHRLVALGLSERTAVLLLYGLALAAGAVAIATLELALDVSLLLISSFSIVITLIGLYLAGVKVYSPEEVERAEKRPLVALLIDVGYKRRFFEVLLDLVLIIAAYYGAYRIQFGPIDGGYDWQRFFDTLPIVIGTKILVFLLTGLYRGLWRYVSVEEAVTFVRAVGAASVASVLVLLATQRFVGLSRVVFLLDGLILFVLVVATRSSFRIFRALVRGARGGDAARNGRRTLIVGAGDAGELLLRELRNNQALGRTAVAFFDDDARKGGKTVHGLPVYSEGLADVMRRENVEEVIVSTNKLPPQRIEELAAACAAQDVPLQRLTVTIAPL